MSPKPSPRLLKATEEEEERGALGQRPALNSLNKPQQNVPSLGGQHYFRGMASAQMNTWGKFLLDFLLNVKIVFFPQDVEPV